MAGGGISVQPSFQPTAVTERDDRCGNGSSWLQGAT